MWSRIRSACIPMLIMAGILLYCIGILRRLPWSAGRLFANTFEVMFLAALFSLLALSLVFWLLSYLWRIIAPGEKIARLRNPSV